MRIAVAVLPDGHVASHAGRARRFVLFDAGADGSVRPAGALELAADDVLHFAGDGRGHPIDGAAVLIAGSSGQGFRDHMARRGILAVLTAEPDPEQAVRDYLAGVEKPAPALVHPHENPHERADGETSAHAAGVTAGR